MRVIYDCDNTFGLAGRDIDDGLTLLYLLGREDIELLGVTLTYGNGNLQEVNQQTAMLQEKLALNFTYYNGLEQSQAYQQPSPAAEYLINTVKTNPKQISIIATGSLSNLAEAYHYYNDFFQQIKQLIVMGGTLQPLILRAVEVNELNFSVNPIATKVVFENAHNLVVLDGHVTAQAIFSSHDLINLMNLISAKLTSQSTKWFADSIQHWLKLMQDNFKLDGFFNWDVCTAIWLTTPELFKTQDTNIDLSQCQWQIGRIQQSSVTATSTNKIKKPVQIVNLKAFNQELISNIVKALG